MALGIGRNVVRRTLIRALNYSNVARSTTVTSRVLINGAVLRTLGASLIYSTVGATVHRLFLRVICNHARATFSRNNLPVNTNLRSLNGNLHSRINAAFTAGTGNPHCLRLTRNCVAGVTVSRGSTVVNCGFMRLNGVVRVVGGNMSTGRTLTGTDNRCNHISSTTHLVSPERRWKKGSGNVV